MYVDASNPLRYGEGSDTMVHVDRRVPGDQHATDNSSSEEVL